MVDTNAHVRAVASFHGTLPPALLDAIIAQSDLRYLSTLAYRSDLTAAHTTTICARYTDVKQDVPGHVLRAHIRACGATPLVEVALSTSFARSRPTVRGDVSTTIAEAMVDALTIAQHSFLLTQGTDALALAIVALHGQGALDDRLAAVLRDRKSTRLNSSHWE